MTAANYWLAMVVPRGHAIHALDPANDRPLCENNSAKWSRPPLSTLKHLKRTGQPTCAHCRRLLGL